MIAVINNNMGNLRSFTNTLDRLSVDYVVTSSKEEIDKSSKIIFPGVGNFKKGAENLVTSGLRDILIDNASRKPILGVCVGMQLLFEKGFEDGESSGLGLIPGEVHSIKDRGLKLPIPHIGWNDISFGGESSLLEGIEPGECVYFVHSYEAITEDKYILAKTDYGADIVAAVTNGQNVYGVQFHPEKSQKTGLKIIKNFLELC